MKNQWESLIARIRKEATDILGNSKDGAAIVTVHILMDNEGEPLVWVLPKGFLVEPRKSSLELLTKYLTRT